MNRQEHLQWCKDRAIEYVDSDDNQQAFASFMSDMSKHPETSNHLALEMGMTLLKFPEVFPGCWSMEKVLIRQ